MIVKHTPNFTKGRGGYKPEIIVIHIMSGTLPGTDQWFADPKSQASSHYGVGLQGEIHQYVDPSDTAWTQGYHQGATFKLHKEGVNPNLYCLSIECEGYDLSKGPETQLNSMVGLIRGLVARYGIPADRDHIIGHYEVDPVRKPNCPSTDKKILDWLVVKVVGTKPTVPPAPLAPTTADKVGIIKQKLEEVTKLVGEL